METSEALSIKNAQLTPEITRILSNHPFSRIEEQPFLIHLMRDGKVLEPRSVSEGEICDITISFTDGISYLPTQNSDGRVTDIDLKATEDSPFAGDLDLIVMFLETVFRTLSKQQT